MSIKSLSSRFSETIIRATGADSFYEIGVIQDLWSGYGQIIRVGLKGSEFKSVVIKHVMLPDMTRHPRGWNTDFSHQRKIRSYEVELEWYRNYADKCSDGCRIPHCLALDSEGDKVLMVLEDLNESGFPKRRSSLRWDGLAAALGWLAEFHAIFMGSSSGGLWPVGTYWHLDTRPDELDELHDLPLKNAASSIDFRLNSATFQTLVHGDAKIANFCFGKNPDKVAMVDFQYVGGGCGMKDVAYFFSSCLGEDECEEYEAELLDIYFSALCRSLSKHQPQLNAAAVEKEWRELYPVAWTDFYRFLKGWCPGHWKINSYSERISREVIRDIVG